MSDPITTVTEFLDDLSQGKQGLYDAVRRWFTPATVWENVGFSTTTGIDEAIALTDKMVESMGIQQIRVETLAIAAVGNKVLTERVDHMTDASGRSIAPVRLMGIFEVEAGKIVRWADYVDGAVLQRALTSQS